MRWWNRELARQVLVLPLIVPSLFLSGDVLLRSLLAWDLYATGYLVLTWLTFRRREPAELYRVALASRPSARDERWFLATPDQLSQSAALVALSATVAALPRIEALGLTLVIAVPICALAIITSWLVLQIGFAVSYLTQYAQQGGFEFPGDEEPVMVDFLYFAFAVGTTFGTTDVTVTQRRVRRRVLTHSTLAFVFNTLILATAVSYFGGR